MELPLHPKLVHIPVALAVIIPLFSLGVLFGWWRQWWSERGWIVIVALQAVLVFGAFASMQTGEDDEELVEHIVGHDTIHEHEELAETFSYAAAGLLALMIVPLIVRKKKKLSHLLAGASVAGSIAVLFFAVQTGEAGGRLVYEHGAGSAYSSGAAAEDPGEGHDAEPMHDDDDDDDN